MDVFCGKYAKREVGAQVYETFVVITLHEGENEINLHFKDEEAVVDWLEDINLAFDEAIEDFKDTEGA